MPWIKQENCVGCGICVEKCSFGAISIKNRKAVMDDSLCVRCGICHSVCPFNAVRHDSERIPLEIETNINWVNDLMDNFKTTEERKAFIGRIKKYFSKEKAVAEKTLQEIQKINI